MAVLFFCSAGCFRTIICSFTLMKDFVGVGGERGKKEKEE